MRTITKKIELFKFSALSPAAKDRARQDYATDEGYHAADEAMASIKALAAHFDGRVSDYSIDWTNSSYSSMTFDMPDSDAMDTEEIGRRLQTLGTYDRKTLRGHGDCALTGNCADEDAIDGFRLAWFENERDLNKLMQRAYGTWIAAAHADYADFYSDEQFGEHCAANDYEFTADGKFWVEQKARPRKAGAK